MYATVRLGKYRTATTACVAIVSGVATIGSTYTKATQMKQQTMFPLTKTHAKQTFVFKKEITCGTDPKNLHIPGTCTPHTYHMDFHTGSPDVHLIHPTEVTKIVSSESVTSFSDALTIITVTINTFSRCGCPILGTDA